MLNKKQSETKLCKHCQTAIPKKAKVCPQCRRKQGGFLQWFIIIIVVIIIMMSMCGKKEENNADSSSDKQIQVNETENRADNENNGEISDSDFDVKEYIYENTIGDTLYFVIVKNNSNQNVSVSANATAKDANGNSIGADDMSIDIIGVGETSIGCFYFDGVTGVEKVECNIKYKKESYYTPIINSLSVEQTLNKTNVILSVTNNAEEPARFVEATALFLDAENNVVWYDSKSITDDDLEIKSSDTISAQLDVYGEYDHAEIYYVGKSWK